MHEESLSNFNLSQKEEENNRRGSKMANTPISWLLFLHEGRSWWHLSNPYHGFHASKWIPHGQAILENGHKKIQQHQQQRCLVDTHECLGGPIWEISS